LATLTTEQLIERLDASGIANARMNTPDEVWEHPQLKGATAGARWTRRSLAGDAAAAGDDARLRGADRCSAALASTRSAS